MNTNTLQRFQRPVWFSLGTPVSSTNKTDRHDITEMLLKVALNTISHQRPTLKSVEWVNYTKVLKILLNNCQVHISRFLLSYLGPLIFLLPKTFKSFGVECNWIRRHAHYIWYIRLYSNSHSICKNNWLPTFKKSHTYFQ